MRNEETKVTGDQLDEPISSELVDMMMASVVPILYASLVQEGTVRRFLVELSKNDPELHRKFDTVINELKALPDKKTLLKDARKHIETLTNPDLIELVHNNIEIWESQIKDNETSALELFMGKIRSFTISLNDGFTTLNNFLVDHPEIEVFFNNFEILDLFSSVMDKFTIYVIKRDLPLKNHPLPLYLCPFRTDDSRIKAEPHKVNRSYEDHYIHQDLIKRETVKHDYKAHYEEKSEARPLKMSFSIANRLYLDYVWERIYGIQDELSKTATPESKPAPKRKPPSLFNNTNDEKQPKTKKPCITKCPTLENETPPSTKSFGQ